ncbi:MAG: hypothetical protein AB7V46_04265 [Thermomicrobiales bacterium]
MDLEATLCRYLNSGLPIALMTPGHLTALIGYGYENGDLFFVCSDDNVGAYKRDTVRLSGKDKWTMLLVPMPARILVPGAAAEIKARLVFSEQAGATEQTVPVLDALAAGKLQFRTYAVDAADYKARLEKRGPGDDVVHHHRRVPASVWIWVTEFQLRDVDAQPRVVGEVAIDATSDPRDPQALFANLPGRVVSWLPGEATPQARPIPEIAVYDSAMEFRGKSGKKAT